MITNDGAIILEHNDHTIYVYDHYHEVLAEFSGILSFYGYSFKQYMEPNSNKIVELKVAMQ